jgi:hypothetical protein
MNKKFRRSVGVHFIALFLCAVFGLGIIGLGERSEAKESWNGLSYHAVVLKAEQPHSGQDRGDESDVMHTLAPSIYTNTSAATLTYRPGSLTPIGDFYGNQVYWLPG